MGHERVSQTMPRRHIHQPYDFIMGEDEGHMAAKALFSEDILGRDLVTLILGACVSSETNHRFQTAVPLERGRSLASPFDRSFSHDPCVMPLTGEPGKAAEQRLDQFQIESCGTPDLEVRLNDFVDHDATSGHGFTTT